MDLLLLIDDDNIKDFEDLCFTKRKIKIENGFARVVYSVSVVKMC